MLLVFRKYYLFVKHGYVQKHNMKSEMRVCACIEPDKIQAYAFLPTPVPCPIRLKEREH